MKTNTEFCRTWRQKNPRYAESYYKKNKEKINERRRKLNWKKYRAINPDGSLFTMVNFDRLYQIQQGKCAICKKHNTELKKTLAVDHDHNTSNVRGLLCGACNSGIGHLKDDINILTAATEYLKERRFYGV